MFTWWAFGMHLFWWAFWILLIVSFFSLLTPVPRKQAHLYRLTPLEILQRRYAGGQISTDEYEERKARLERDKAASAPATTAHSGSHV